MVEGHSQETLLLERISSVRFYTQGLLLGLQLGIESGSRESLACLSEFSASPLVSLLLAAYEWMSRE